MERDCFVCKKALQSSYRRKLNSSCKGVRFLETFGQIPESRSKEDVYVCKPCLARLEKGEDTITDVKELVSNCRKYFGLSAIEVKAVSQGDCSACDCESKITSWLTICYLAMVWASQLSPSLNW